MEVEEALGEVDQDTEARQSCLTLTLQKRGQRLQRSLKMYPRKAHSLTLLPIVVITLLDLYFVFGN